MIKLTPHHIFLIDGLGALFTAAGIGIIAKWLNSYFNLPLPVLYTLGSIALLFSAYSLTSHWLAKNRWKLFLKIICIANLSYCILSCVIALVYLKELSWWAVAYFFAEAVIVSTLVWAELQIVKKEFLELSFKR
ncbi:MAG: hypothetical protein EAZ67_04265 [Cytophagales bacterium]|nr:MAG: hypothetical protein EAZ67_04265 [Cytophagales bacterium]